VFVGTTLTGSTVILGGRSVLLSPARVRVSHYLKGAGPHVVSVATAVTGGGHVVSEDGIEPRAGQQWTIYTRSPQMPYQTSMCDGSRLSPAPPPG
jgi:hypothetical protein